MSDKKLPWWVSGPPGTGKTRGFIKKIEVSGRINLVYLG